jgi:hypothetical protein
MAMVIPALAPQPATPANDQTRVTLFEFRTESGE